MARVLGVGGVFFKSRDPERLRDWYERWLGVTSEGEGVPFLPGALPAGGCTVWSPFREDTRYFDPADKAYMFNLIVDDLDAALQQVRTGGATLAGEIETYPNGHFGWFLDPDGNKVELWEPKAEATS